MASASAHSSTTGMVGGGFYDANSAPQMSAITAVLPWISKALAELDLPAASQTIALADFGCSEGRNSIDVMRHAISDLRKRTSQPIQTLHSDLPTNDFSNLMRALRTKGHSVFEDRSVYSAAVPGSMFDQLFPPESLDFAFTFNAIGFLSGRPVEVLPDYLLPNGPSKIRGRGSVSEADQATFAKQAKDDVAAFLRARASELRPGGKVMLQVFGANEVARTCDGIYDLLNDAVLDFVEKGDIDPDIYRRYYQPVYFRSLDELVSPLKDGSPVSDLFQIDQAASYEVPVPFVEAFKTDGDLGNYAKAYVDFFRAFTEAVLRMALAPRPDLETLVEAIYQRAEELLKASPDTYPFRYTAVATLLTKKGS